MRTENAFVSFPLYSVFIFDKFSNAFFDVNVVHLPFSSCVGSGSSKRIMPHLQPAFNLLYAKHW